MKPLITVFQDYEPEGHTRAVWIGIDFEIEGVPWTKKIEHIDLNHYETQDIYDFHDNVVGCSVRLEEITASYIPNHIGINLGKISERLLGEGQDPIKIERFILQVCDVQEVLASVEEVF
jgi:hypothetical protein